MSSGAPQVILTPEFFRQFGIKHSASSKLSAKGVRFDSIRSQKQLKAMVPYVPEAGDIVMMDFDPQVGHEQAKRRPALVLTDQRYNRASGLTVVCPVTSQRKPYPFALPVRVAQVERAVLVDQLKSLDWAARKTEFHSKTDPGLVSKVRQYIAVLLAIR
jgi:mRNA interferase MazF